MGLKWSSTTRMSYEFNSLINMDSHTLFLRFPIPPNKAGYLSTIKDICKQTWQVQKPNMSDILTGIYNCPLQRKIWGILGLLSTQLVSSSFQTPSVVPLHHKVKEPDYSVKSWSTDCHLCRLIQHINKYRGFQQKIA